MPASLLIKVYSAASSIPPTRSAPRSAMPCGDPRLQATAASLAALLRTETTVGAAGILFAALIGAPPVLGPRS